MFLSTDFIYLLITVVVLEILRFRCLAAFGIVLISTDKNRHYKKTDMRHNLKMRKSGKIVGVHVINFLILKSKLTDESKLVFSR